VKIAFLACAETLPGSPTRRADAFEHDRQVGALRTGLGNRAEVSDRDWRAPLDQLTGFDLALLGTAWDYTDHKPEFLARLDELEAAGVIVCNPAEVVRWNGDKLYLRELAQRGVVSIPTLWPEAPVAADIVAAFDHFGTDRVVVKRRVGAGAVGQFSFTRAAPPAPDWRMDQPAMIQPFLPAIQSEGEYSLIFIDGAFSHALIKTAAPGDYRIQSLYGGRETPITPTPGDLATAQGVIALLPFAQPPLYARIDMVRGLDGQLALIEAELIEPYLYPEQGPKLGSLLAEAVLKRVNRS
jgi:glutathione synthase/RimK-type ligase-like ATP-grasp enzyme